MSAEARPVADTDAPGLIALIAACWGEYPGCIMDLDEVPELQALATHLAARGGAGWVVAEGDAITGMVTVTPGDGDTWEIGKMYVAASRRGTGLAARLLRRAEAHAVAAGAARMVLWSDTRFTTAHRFYEKHAYVQGGALRALGDRSNSIEFRYAKPLTGLVARALDAAEAASAVPALTAVLRRCAAAGDADLPATEATAPAWGRDVARAAATGGAALLAAWLDGAIMGTAQLLLDLPPGHAHRAVPRALLVDPAARRRGVARALLARAEAVAAGAGRRLLTLETTGGTAAEALFRAEGYAEAGRIPGYARAPDGAARDAALFFKALPPTPP